MPKTDPNHPPGAYAQYHSYLLRLWQEQSDSPYRITLQDVQSRAQISFADLEALLAFLTDCLNTLPIPEGENEEGTGKEDHDKPDRL